LFLSSSLVSQLLLSPLVLNETTINSKRDRDGVAEQLQDLQDEYDALEKEKEKLDAEIAKYRELLGQGEQRLGIESPAAAAGAAPQKKRKRIDPETGLHHLRARVKTDKGSVGFSAVPESGRLIRLHNEGTEVQSLRGWKLTATGANKQAVFNFPDDAAIGPDAQLTIHISGQKGPGRTPSREAGSLNWRTSAFWKKGGALVLLDEQERVQSTAELALEEGGTAQPLTTEESHDGLPAPADGAEGDQRCAMM
jgi:hypothetical protein